ncbi:MAG: T9SS type A sorting domain-containing protein [Flavobacteriales bacterium]|nr:T9SS type A sorting domain-containing protein [Flavobacteriales bacterium]
MARSSFLLGLMLLGIAPSFAQQPGDLDLSFSGDGIATAHFAPIGNDAAMGMAIQPNGRIVVVGSTQQNLATSMALARFMPDGTLDQSFGIGGQVITGFSTDPVLISDAAAAVAIQPNGYVVVVGSSFQNGVGYRFVVARYDPDGELDPNFGTGGIQVNALLNGGGFGSVAILDDGYIVACGAVTEAPSNNMFVVARYTPFGALDPTFDGDGFATIDITPDDDDASALVMEPGGTILVAGNCGGGADRNIALVRLAQNGSLDPSLDGDGIVVTALSTGDDAATSVAIQPADGKILVAGATTSMPFVFLVVLRYDFDGALDNTFAGDGIFQSPHPGINLAGGMALAPDGRIVVGGTWGTNFLVAVVLPDGTADMGFDDEGVVTTSFGQNGYGTDLALDADGKAVLVGSSGQGAPTGNDFVVLRYHTGIGVGVPENDERANVLSVVPNPASDLVRVSGRVNDEMRVVDVTGRALLVRTLRADQQWIDASGWARGTYVIMLEREGRILRERMVLQ